MTKNGNSKSKPANSFEATGTGRQTKLPAQPTRFDWQRLGIGVIGIVFLLFGIASLIFNSEGNPAFPGVAIRVGALLVVIWLAMPQLESIKSLLPAYMLLIAILLLLILAVRPNLFRVIAGILAVAMTLSWVLKWVAKLSNTSRR